MNGKRFEKSFLLLFCLSIIYCCLVSSEIVIDNTLYIRLFSLSVIILLVSLFLIFRYQKTKLYIDKFSLIYFLYVVFKAASISWSVNKSVAIGEASKSITFFLFFILLQSLLTKYRKPFIELLLKNILIIVFLSFFYLISQFNYSPSLKRFDLYSVYGISGHKNLYSSFIYLSLVLSIFGSIFLKKKWKTIALALIIIQFLLIITLQTRAVWLGFIVFILFAVLLNVCSGKNKEINPSKITRIVLTNLVIMNIIFLLVLPKLIDTYNNNKPLTYNQEDISDLSTFSERTQVWQKTYDIINDNILFGVGANNWRIKVPNYSLPSLYRLTDLNTTFKRPHNDFLWILAEYGLIGFNLFFILFIYIVVLILTQKSNNNKLHNIILSSGIVGFLVISFFSFPSERVEHNILLTILLAISTYNIKKSNPNQLPIKTITLTRSFLLIILPILVFICYINLVNIKGEYFTKKLYIERIKKNNDEVIKLSDYANSLFYSVDPTTVPINWYKGNANVNLGNYKEAMIDFSYAIKKTPYNHYLINDLGSLHYIQNNEDSAIFYYKESIRINPRFDDPKLNLAVIYINNRNYLEAKKWNESIFHDSERRNKYRKIIDDNLNN